MIATVSVEGTQRRCGNLKDVAEAGEDRARSSSDLPNDVATGLEPVVEDCAECESVFFPYAPAIVPTQPWRGAGIQRQDLGGLLVRPESARKSVKPILCDVKV